MKPHKLLRLLSADEENVAKAAHQQVPLTLKYDTPFEVDRYLHIPRTLLRSEHLSASAKIVYLILCSYASHERSGVYVLASPSSLARDCCLSESALDDAVDELVTMRLVTRADESQITLHVHAPRNRAVGGCLSIIKPGPLTLLQSNMVNAPQNQTITRNNKDTHFLEESGIREDVAKEIAQLPMRRGWREGYVHQMEYMTTPNIRKPAGCSAELTRRNEPGQFAKQSPTRMYRHKYKRTRDVEKYTSGKHAFLGQVLETESRGSVRGTERQPCVTNANPLEEELRS